MTEMSPALAEEIVAKFRKDCEESDELPTYQQMWECEMAESYLKCWNQVKPLIEAAELMKENRLWGLSADTMQITLEDWPELKHGAGTMGPNMTRQLCEAFDKLELALAALPESAKLPKDKP